MNIHEINERILKITAVDSQYKNGEELLASLLEELGEVATELKIENQVFGNAHKKSEEGVIAESVDLYICCISMFYFGFIVSDGGLVDEEAVKKRINLLEMKDTIDLKWASDFYYLKEILHFINVRFVQYVEAAQVAINLAFKKGCTEEQFIEIANKKLNKWERSQNACIENMEAESPRD